MHLSRIWILRKKLKGRGNHIKDKYLILIREERIKRTQDIAENAAAEIRDSNEVLIE